MHDRHHAALRGGQRSQQGLRFRKTTDVIGKLALEEGNRVRARAAQYAEVGKQSGFAQPRVVHLGCDGVHTIMKWVRARRCQPLFRLQTMVVDAFRRQLNRSGVVFGPHFLANFHP